MTELTGITYPRTRLWSPDYEQVLWDSETGAGTAEDWFAASGHDTLGMSVDYGESWRTRRGARIERQEDGSVRVYDHSEYLKYLLVPPNPFVTGAATGVEGKNP